MTSPTCPIRPATCSLPAPRPRRRYDVAVVGARAAGASTALLLARAGLRVVVLERSPYGSDTLSTHALMRTGVLQLHRWGLLDAVRAAGTPPVRKVTFHYPDESLTLDVKPTPEVDALYAPRRTVLDRVLVDAARDAGAELRFGVRVEELLRDDAGTVVGLAGSDDDGRRFEIQADIVVGADGMRSTVARLVDAPVTHAAQATMGVAYAYFEGVEATGYEWYYSPGLAAGIIPTNHGAACVFAGAPPDRYRLVTASGVRRGLFQLLADTSPELERRVAAGTPVGAPHGFPGLVGHLRRPWGPGWALVGDAGYFKDPISTHGISDALRDAEILARSIVSLLGTGLRRWADLADYEQVRDALSLPLMGYADRIASFDWTLAEVRGLLREMSRAMGPEADYLLSLDGETRAVAA